MTALRSYFVQSIHPKTPLTPAGGDGSKGPQGEDFTIKPGIYHQSQRQMKISVGIHNPGGDCYNPGAGGKP